MRCHRNFAVREKSYLFVISTLTSEEIVNYFKCKGIVVDCYEDVLHKSWDCYVNKGINDVHIDELIYLSHKKRNRL